MIKFHVPGAPAPGGSKTAFRNKHSGKIAIMDAGKNNAGWKQRVSAFASGAMAGRKPLEGPLRLTMEFSVSRPKHHYGTGKNASKLKPWALEAMPTSKPDLTKLIRAAEDALKGICWIDDSQVVRQVAAKDYGTPGVEIAIEPFSILDRRGLWPVVVGGDVLCMQRKGPMTKHTDDRHEAAGKFLAEWEDK